MPDYNLRYAGTGTMMGGTKPSKAAARYTPAGGRERCGQCRHFVPASACNRIVGPVSAMGWCSYFSREMAVLLQPGATYGGGIGPNAPAIDLSLLGPTLDPSITFTRASTATYFDVAGVMQTATANTPRFDYDPVTHVLNGLLVEGASTNLLLNSATLGTQSVAVTAQLYTLSFYGTGTITKSGTASGALVGAGAFPTRVTQSFTPTAGTLTCTVTGSVLNAQLVAGPVPTSYIPTAGATATRATELAVITSTPWLTPLASTLASEYIVSYGSLPGGSAYVSAELMEVTEQNSIILRNGPGGNANTAIYVGNVGTPQTIAGPYVINGVTKHIVATDGTALTGATAINGAAAVPFTLTAPPSAAMNRLQIAMGRSVPLSGWMRRVRYWPRVLSNAELQAQTL